MKTELFIWLYIVFFLLELVLGMGDDYEPSEDQTMNINKGEETEEKLGFFSSYKK